MVDRFVIAAIVDRLIYDDDTTFSPDDARALLAALPRKPSPWIQLGVAGKMSGGSSQGLRRGRRRHPAEGRQGSPVRIHHRWRRVHPGRPMEADVDRQAHRQYVEIEQVMADATDDGRGALISYEPDGTPIRMDIRFNRSFRLFWSPVVIMFPGWKPWKTPS